MSKLNNLWERNNKTTIDIDNQLTVRSNNDSLIKQANQISNFSKLFQGLGTEFSLLSSLIIDDAEQYYYKKWQIQILELTDNELLSIESNIILDLIGANLNYNIIYNESTENQLEFYNLGSELKEVSFFTIEGNILFFNVSLFIKKVFDGAEIINPQAKIDIKIKPFYTIKN